ncbi:MAG: DUF6338 family protein [Pseudomonadota bacterium]
MKLDPTTLQLILLLMPGLIGAGVHSYFRNRALSTASLVIFSVLLAMFASLIAAAMGQPPPQPADFTKGDWTELARSSHFYIATLAACLLGAVTALVIESRKLQHLFERASLTRHYSTDDTWEHVFRENDGRWLVLHMSDGSRITGYAKYYSMTGQAREICLGEARIEPPEEKVGKLTRRAEARAARGDLLITDIDAIMMVEFIESANGEAA